MRRILPLLPALALVLLAGCPDDEVADNCSLEIEKRATADLVYDWYLYPDLLPEVIDTSAYTTPAQVLDAMTAEARAQGLDRGWSFVTTVAASQTFFAEGTSVGLGIGLLERDAQVFVSQVYPGSAAADAGFARGDQLLRVGETEATLAAVTPDNVSTLLGPATEGVTRVVEVLPWGAAVPVIRGPATKRTFGLDPVPAVGTSGERWKIFERPPKKLGYVALRTFIEPADPLLTQAFQAFHDAGVTDVVVDLRYNGGGLVATGELLSNLLGGGISGTMYTLAHNPDRASFNNVTRPFAPPASALTPEHIAFITTGASASASELVPNVLEAYRGSAVGLVGAKTYGKPVGQRGFQRRTCDTLWFIVSFRVQNAQGDGAYYAGLPDEGTPPAFSGPLCPAADDLGHETSSELEASTAAALAFLESGTCPAPPAPPAAKLGLATAARPDSYPVAPEPSLAQRHVSGLF